MSILLDYLNAYSIALKNQPFNRIYIDAFAGTGNVEVKLGDYLFKIDGSARLALGSEPPFSEYMFIEKNKVFAKELEGLIEKEYGSLKTTVLNEDCNIALTAICKNINWNKNRALLFLDPYAMDVNWSTLKLIAETKAIDVWYLFPLSATNRLLKSDGRISDSWRNKLNQIFGNTDWYEEMYKEDEQINLFEEKTFIKNINVESLSQYIVSRLETTFPKVAKNPRILYNSNNTPLFLFCFAISNESPAAQGLALIIANHILKKEY